MTNTRNPVLFALATALFLLVTCVAPKDDQREIEFQVHDLINDHRLDMGLDTLAWSDIIAKECRIHSQNMADGTVAFGHDGFLERIENIRLELNVVAAGENVAYNSGMTDPAQAAVDAWLASPGHRQNIEGDFRLTGVGVARNDNVYYFTQIFVKNE